MGQILVVGCASLDTIHLSSGKTVSSIGGAGLYTALAARRAGASVTLFAPRPEPMPEILTQVDRLLSWIGPAITIDRMPSLEIAHHGQGRATLLGASWGAELLLTPETLAEYIELNFDITHIAALSSASRQAQFVSALREPGGHKISVGTYARAINDDISTVRFLVGEADLFFMNKNEATLLGIQADSRSSFGFENHPSKTVFISDGANGVTIITDTTALDLPAVNAVEVDPTGAGDTFCGTTIAMMSAGSDAKEAAQQGIYFAAKAVEQPGPGALLGQT